MLGMHPSGHRARWDAAADAELAGRANRGELLRDIARAMGRTQEACRSRANILKLAVRSSHRRARVGVHDPLGDGGGSVVGATGIEPVTPPV